MRKRIPGKLILPKLNLVPLVVASTALLFMCASPSPAQAQETELVAHVPFAFIVGNATMPSGDYVVTHESNDPSVIGIASADQKHFVNTLTVPTSVESSGQAELVFDKVGADYFLARVIPAGSEERDILVNPGAAEREVAASSTTR